jgi:hypothetical protein
MTDSNGSLPDLVEQIKGTHRFHTREKIILLEALKNHFMAEVTSVVDDVIVKRVERFGHIITQREGSGSLADLFRLLWDPERNNGLVITIRGNRENIKCYS